MDNSMICSVRQQGKPTKFKTKPKGKPKQAGGSPVKVVYISNPIMVKATASEFRALVQELTGQDSELPDPARFSPQGAPPAPDDRPRAALADDAGKEVSGLGGVSLSAEEEDDDPLQEVPAVGPELYTRFPDGGPPFDEDSDDQDFMPQMLENLVELWPSSFLYRS